MQIVADTEYYFHYLETHKIFQRCWIHHPERSVSSLLWLKGTSWFQRQSSQLTEQNSPQICHQLQHAQQNGADFSPAWPANQDRRSRSQEVLIFKLTQKRTWVGIFYVRQIHWIRIRLHYCNCQSGKMMILSYQAVLKDVSKHSVYFTNLHTKLLEFWLHN